MQDFSLQKPLSQKILLVKKRLYSITQALCTSMDWLSVEAGGRAVGREVE